MKTKLFLICFLLYCSSPIGYTQIQQLSTSSRSVSATINVAAGKLDNIRLSQQTPTQALVQEMDLKLEAAELIINYHLKPTEGQQHYLLGLDIQLNGEAIQPSPRYLKGWTGKDVYLNHNNSLQIVWTDLLEQRLNLEGELTVTLTAELWGKPILPYGIDCEVVPEFNLQWAHYLGAAIGAGAIGAGFLLGNQADDIYNDEYLPAPTEEVAEPHFQNANDKRHQSIILKYSGAGLLLIDAVWYSIRYFRFKNRLNAFNEYCTQNSLTVNPVHFAPNSYAQDQQHRLGLQVTFTF